ncbi:MAG: phosphoenolpyruvate--protein phosphotransferase [Candidatus Omnitrophica bacterium]|nr:phosphoenolpyruvate--protein phosphotransferase [Candidatus Omnitrophota bacterium]MCA9424748.1 phosphoenolpyruvate--protein phosphotransferase [Candidatus Omnitrophota bacterium]MCA9430892.1 phosphoenolpyruvate--protein phosphotransferase [Candidatus Omnitrophota bacterium]MCA9439746.1 phosphoenolpyruvate--protein phosphotransferase [Candidatus Omnitrophota bacterium]
MIGNQQKAMILGMVASQGIARGPAFVCPCIEDNVIRRRTISDDEISQEISRFERALSEAESEILNLQTEIRENLGDGDAAILEAQSLFLYDQGLRDEIISRCREEKINVEAAVSDVAANWDAAFGRIESPYFRDRAADLRDVTRRILDRLFDEKQRRDHGPSEPHIVVVRELYPTILASLDKRQVLGLIAETGGPTAHAVILARSMGIPTLINVDSATTVIKRDDQVILDGFSGRVFINPSESLNLEYEKIVSNIEAHQQSLREEVNLPAITTDGVEIKLNVNVGKVADATAAANVRADGIGLYRTEFVFLVQDHPPTEEEQLDLYRKTCDEMQLKEVVIRVLDMGSDKILPYFPLSQESNPSLGHRGTRLMLRHPEILRPQLRAILRLSATHPVSVLFPMIVDVEAIVESKRIVKSVQAELQAEGRPFNPEIRVGAMIETPAAAILGKWIARESDFLSIGTNDLIQYFLTSDRTNTEMSSYYEPVHPAVIQILKSVIDAANAENKEVSLCGEMAGNPAYTELLLGLGLRSLSVTPSELLELKRVIRSLTMTRATERSKHILQKTMVSEIKAILSENSPMMVTGDRE